MIRAFRLALAQLGDPRIRAVLVKSVLLTLALFAAAATLIGWALAGANPCSWGPLDRDCTIGGGASVLIAFVLGIASLWLLFPALAIGVLGLFSDEVVEAVEELYYPAAAASARPPTAAEGLALGLRSAGRLLLWNAMALPFYVLLLVTGLGPFLLFFAINAVALGRDLGEMVAVRRHRGPELERWLAANRVRRAALGLVVTFLFMVPFANLLAPVVGAAMATHLFREEGR